MLGRDRTKIDMLIKGRVTLQNRNMSSTETTMYTNMGSRMQRICLIRNKQHGCKATRETIKHFTQTRIKEQRFHTTVEDPTVIVKYTTAHALK